MSNRLRPLLLVLSLGLLVASAATAVAAARVYVLEEGVELPSSLADANLRELPGLRLAVAPDGAPLVASQGVRALDAAPGEELFLVDLHHHADVQALAYESRVLHTTDGFAVIAAGADRTARLDRLGMCRERLTWIAPSPPRVRDVSIARPKVDVAVKQEIVDAVSQSRFSQILRELSGNIVFWLDGQLTSTDNRYTHTQGSGADIDIAANYLEDRFETAGLTVLRQPFPVGGTTAENIIAVKEGTGGTDEIIVIGAHYDSISENPTSLAPGAEDNGSGTAAVLMLAEIFADYDTEKTIHFICFSGEEQGLYGSQYYVNQLGANGWNVTNSLIMDMISAWVSNYKVIIEGETPWESLMSLFETNVTSYAQIASRKDYFSFGSDHVPFQNAGIPCFLAIDWDYGDYADYHRTTDTYDKTDTSLGWRIAKAMAASLADLANPSSTSVGVPVRTDMVTLAQNYPNPFNPNTTLSFYLPGDGETSLRIFDVSGRLVRTLVAERLGGGRHEAQWDGTDAAGRSVASGLYHARLEHPRGTQSRRLVLTK